MIEINYHWFYSALSQSLAALFGVVGLFISLRLQTQNNKITESLRDLQLHLASVKTNVTYIFTSEKRTLKIAQETIRELNTVIDRQKDNIIQYEKNIEGNHSVVAFREKKHNSEKEIRRDKRKRETISDQLRDINLKKEREKLIKDYAYGTMKLLLGAFCFSLLCLLGSGFLKNNIVVGTICTLITFGVIVEIVIKLLQCYHIGMDTDDTYNTETGVIILKIRKAIIKEGPILLGVLLGYIFIGNKLCYQGFCITVSNIILSLYIFYIIVRLISQAIKTLRKKEEE